MDTLSRHDMQIEIHLKNSQFTTLDDATQENIDKWTACKLIDHIYDSGEKRLIIPFSSISYLLIIEDDVT